MTGSIRMNTEEGCSAICCPNLSVTLVGKCRDPDTAQEDQDSLARVSSHRRGDTHPHVDGGPVGTWGSQTHSLVDRTKFTHQMFIEIRQVHSRALWVPTGWVMVKGLGSHQVMLVRMHLGRDAPGEGCTGEVRDAAPNPSGLALGAGKTPPRSMPHGVLSHERVAE